MNENNDMKDDGQEKFYTEKEAAAKCRVSWVTLYRARKAKRLGFHKIGTRVLISESQLKQFIESCEQNVSQT
jgi:excisionase family DNA binding protein